LISHESRKETEIFGNKLKFFEGPRARKLKFLEGFGRKLNSKRPALSLASDREQANRLEFIML